MSQGELDENRQYAARIRSERKRLGLNQTDLATHAGVELATQSRYELGKQRPKVDYLAAIAALGVDTHYILTGRQSGGDILSDEEGSIIHNARSLDAQKRDALARLTAAMAGNASPPPIPSEEALTLMFQAMLLQLVPPIDDPDAARTLARRLPAALAQTRGRDLAQVQAESPAADTPPPPPAKRRPARLPTPRT